jgi:glutamate dehydrogenase
VFSRSAKSIPISAEAREVLAIEDESLAPADLIRALLRAPVDLLFNGGIGTYVKATEEAQADADDKANDALRVNGAELRCRVVGEGGNLGFTQRGRIEYALSGGADGEGGQINTDAIDNAAGVNCSDHEVNIKILLDGIVSAGELSNEARNALLVEMTDAVAERVLYGSYTQTQAMSLALKQAPAMIGVHARLISQLEQDAGLNRKLEDLPTEKAVADRRAQRRGLVSPEIATLIAYCKINLFEELLDSALPDDPYLVSDLERYFPDPLPERYRAQLANHRLRREIIATVVASQLVDRAGTTFAFRLAEETGAPTSQLARAFAVAREVFEMRSFWSDVEALDNRIEAHTQLEMLIDGRRLVERATRWLIRAYTQPIDIEGTTERFSAAARMLEESLPGVLEGRDAESFQQRLRALAEAGVPVDLARRIASMQAVLSVFDIVEDAAASERSQRDVMTTYFALGSRLGLDWLRDRILELPRADRWQALARAALRDDLYRLHRALTRDALSCAEPGAESDRVIEGWRARVDEPMQRALSVMADVKSSGTFDTTTLPVVLRELKSLVRDPAGL